MLRKFDKRKIFGLGRLRLQQRLLLLYLRFVVWPRQGVA